MIRNVFFLIGFFLMLPLSILSQEAVMFSGNIASQTITKGDRLPFWYYTNTQGLLNEDSTYSISAFAKADYKIAASHSISIGGGVYISDGFEDNIRRSDIYVDYKNQWFSLTAGAKREPAYNNNLSVINDNILFTGNVRPLPGVLLSNTTPIKLSSNLSLDAEIAHYNLNDDRSTTGARIHYKMFRLNWRINNSNSLSVGLRHYVQWGGTLADGTELPDDFKAFTRIFVGANGGSIDNSNEAINALGNHLGSYKLDYNRKIKNGTLALYHQSLFEDRSGRELNNFPDGVWGINFVPDGNKLIKSILYEYIQTVSQSGPPRPTEGLSQQSGGDNYFINSIYPSGWSFEGAIIGLPLINPFGNTTTPANNRTIGHHLGIAGTVQGINYKVKGSYIENLGTYTAPFESRQRALYSYAEFSYDANDFGIFNLYLGADYINNFSNTASVGIGYKYILE